MVGSFFYFVTFVVNDVFMRRGFVVKIEAIIRPERLEAVRFRLDKAGYPGMMVTEMEGHGRQKGLHHDWPQSLRINYLPKLKMEIVVEGRDKKKVVEAILDGAYTGEEGDGKIFVYAIKEAIRIRTGEKGRKAVSKLHPDKLRKRAS